MSTQTVSAAVAKKEEPGVVALVRSNQVRFAPVLPDHIEPAQFIGLAVGALFRDPKLMEAANTSPHTLMNALMRCASLGHQPGTEEFYLIPRKNKGKPEIQGIEGYRGIVERMYRSGAVASVIVREVCEGDEFEFIEGEMDRPRHRRDWFAGRAKRGAMIGVYAYAILTTGAVSRVVVLDKDDVMAAKAKSDGAATEFSPWNSKEDGGRSMWWKTAARRLEPWVPTSAEYRREVARAEAQARNATVDLPLGEGAIDAELVPDGAPEAGQ